MIDAFKDRRPTAWTALYVISTFVLIVLYYLRSKGYAVDDSYITYRYADHLKKGYGLVFNVGESYYGTTAAGYAVTLAAVSTALDAICRFLGVGESGPPIETISVFLSAISLGIIALCLTAILRPGTNRLQWIPCAAFALYVFVGYAFNEVAGHETYTFLGVALVGTLLQAMDGKAILAGCVLAIAATLRPDALLLTPIVLALDWRRSSLPLQKYFLHPDFWKYCGGFAVILVPWLTYLYVHFGQVLPGTMDAKKAQVALGYWAHYNAKTILKYVLETMHPFAIVAACIGILALAWELIRDRFKSELLKRREIFLALTWIGFGIGSVCAYSLFNVTFWRWYGVPVVFSIGVGSLVGWKIIIDQFEIASGKITQDRELTRLIRFAPAVVLAILTVGASYDAITWIRSKNDNPHIRAYLEIVDYLKSVEPNGTVVAMFEPGSFGYHLGPRFKVVDELGLISPGVAKALLHGDGEYAMRTYAPKYLVCSWHGSYSACEKSDLLNRFELVGEFDADFWGPRIGQGARLYRRRDRDVDVGKEVFTVRAIALGDRWGKFERIRHSNEWFVHPGETTDTIFGVTCVGKCSGYFWSHIADLPKEAPPEAGDVVVTIKDADERVLFKGEVNRAKPMPRTNLNANTNQLKVIVNNNGNPSYDWVVFGLDVQAGK